MRSSHAITSLVCPCPLTGVVPLRLRLRIVALGLLVVWLPAATGEGSWVAMDLDQARLQADEARDELDELTRRYEVTFSALEEARDEFAALAYREIELNAEAAAIDAQLNNRARRAFMHGSTRVLDSLLTATEPTTAIQRASLFATVYDRESAGLEDVLAVRTALDQTRALARDQQERLSVLAAELAEAQRVLEARFEVAQQTVQSIEQMAERQRTINRGSQQGVYACPLDPEVTHFIDSWGFARSGGRRHKGTDIMGPMGAPVFAFTAGVIQRHYNSQLGGLMLYLRGDDGSTYLYTHLQGFAARGAPGTRVAAGEHIAFNGNTGNARGGAPHIHFERHPGGGAAVNPYSWLVAACF